MENVQKKSIQFRSISELDLFRSNIKETIDECKREFATTKSEDRKNVLNSMIVTNQAMLVKIDILMQDALHKSFDEIAPEIKAWQTAYDPAIFERMQQMTQIAIGPSTQTEDKSQMKIDFGESKETPDAQEETSEVAETIQETIEKLLNPVPYEINIFKNNVQKALKQESFENIAEKLFKALRAQPTFATKPVGELFTDVLLRELKCEGSVSGKYWSWIAKSILNPIKKEKNPVKSILSIKNTIPTLTEEEITELMWAVIRESNGKTEEKEADQMLMESVKNIYQTTTAEAIMKDLETMKLLSQTYGTKVDVPKQVYRLFTLADITPKEKPLDTTKVVIVQESKEKDETKAEKHNPERERVQYVEKSQSRNQGRNKNKKR